MADAHAGPHSVPVSDGKPIAVADGKQIAVSGARPIPDSRAICIAATDAKPIIEGSFRNAEGNSDLAAS
jgi:hypothetical protein